MPRDIRVGDKVRLLGWEVGCEFDGFLFMPGMSASVGREVLVHAIETYADLSPSIDVDGWSWPLSRLEPLSAPRPSAWTKTSEGKPEVGVWVLGWWAESGSDLAAQVVIRLCSDGEWRANDGLDTYFAPDYWQPLPAPPEVPR